MSSQKSSPVPVNSRSHEVTLWVKQRQRAGELKRCARLDIAQISWTSDEYTSRNTFYIPQCMVNSFEWKLGPMTQNGQIGVLIHYLHDNPISCPKNCLKYRSAYAAKITKPLQALWAQHFPKKALDYFFKTMDMPTRLFIIALLIVLFAPKLKDPIIQIIRAFQGK